MAEHGLPRPETQRVLGRTADRIIRVDFRFPGTDVVVEVLGFRYHRSREQLAIDAERMNSLLGTGHRVYQFTYQQVMEQSWKVVRTLTSALPTAA